MNLPELIALDLDGTLLPESKKLTERSREVLARMEALGTTITLATGKFLHITHGYGEALGLTTPLIALDGARIGGDGNELRERGIARDTILELLERYDDPSEDAFADSGSDDMLVRTSKPELLRSFQVWADRLHRIDDIAAKVVADSAILSLYGSAQRMAQIGAEVSVEYPELGATLYESKLTGSTRISFRAAGVSKGSGVGDFADALGVAREDCWVFGDWLNDLPMFEAGCVNVAMANAVPELLAKADHVTEHSCEEDGVARFLELHFL